MAASLTKEQLRNELISHGVQPPLQSARKEEFVKLYEQHVAPIVAQKGDFSSDEETDIIPNAKVPATINTPVSSGLDVASLSDEELFDKLQEFGVPVGPIVESTRTLYQRKLAALLQNGLSDESQKSNGESGLQEEKFSDSEGEPEDELPAAEESLLEAQTIAPDTDIVSSAPAPEPSVSTPDQLTSVRKRVVDRPPSSLNALPLVDRQGTPTPRPSIRSVSGSYTYESRRLRDTTDGPSVTSLKSPTESLPSQKNTTRFILILAIVVLSAIILYMYMDKLKPLVESAQNAIFKYAEKAEEVAEKIDHAKPNLLPEV